MGDLLEKYIIDNRDQFDDLEPSEELWSSVKNQLPVKKRDFSLLWKVAAVLFIASTIYLVIDRQYMPAADVQIAEQGEFYEAEKYYYQLISEKNAVLKDLRIGERNADLIEEVERMDQMYQELKHEYLTKNANEALRDAMVQNLRLRIKILNQQIESLNQNNYEKYRNVDAEI